MFIATSDSPQGPGILALQHEDFDKRTPKWSVDLRGSIRAVRVLDRLDKDLGLGQWTYDTESAGDIHGGQLLKQKKQKRPIPMWRWATPALTVASEDATATGGGAPAFAVRPIFDGEYGEDARLKTFSPHARRGAKKLWPRFPLDFVGISLTANDERRQIDLYHHTDPRLVAVNVAPDALMGTWVCDMGAGFKVDPDRFARLQSAFRVVRPKDGCVAIPPDPDRPGKKLNAIAWQLAPGGQDGVWGHGVVIDRAPGGGGTPTKGAGGGNDVATPSSFTKAPAAPVGPAPAGGANVSASAASGGKRVVALTSYFESGPFDVGQDGNDKHQIGTTEDGEAINANHLSTNSLFKVPMDRVKDGPLDFDGDWIEPTRAPFLVPVYLRWDNKPAHAFVCGARKGRWRWESECIGYSPPTDTPTARPPDDRPPTTTTGSGTSTGDGSVPFEPNDPVRVWVGDDGHQAFAATTMQFAVPAILFRPQDLRSGAEDLRITTHPGARALYDHDSRTPMVLRAEAFAASQAQGWDYTTNQRPCRGRWRNGASDGGIVFLPPEVSIDDYATNFAPAGRTLSTCYVVAGPSTYFAAGLPNLTVGSIKTGYRWGASAAGVLGFDHLTSSSVVDAKIRFDAAGGVGLWDSVGDFWGTFTPDRLTADRAYSIPNASGTLMVTASPFGTFTATQVLFADGAGLPTGSADFTFDDATNVLSVGTSGAAQMVYSAASGTLVLYDSAGLVCVTISDPAGTPTVFNEQGADTDFRIEGDTQTHTVFVDASLDAVGFGTSSLSSTQQFIVNRSHTNLSKYAVTITNTISVTSGGSYPGIGLWLNGTPSTVIATGITDTAYRTEVYCESYRTQGTDLGTLEQLRGVYVISGHLATVGSTATTTGAFGVWVNQRVGAGTVTTMYGLRVDNDTTGGTVTTSYGLYLDAIPSTVAATSTYAIISTRGRVEFTCQALQTFVWNESGVDADFRVEGDTDDSLFFVDASTDFIGVGVAPSVKFHVESSIAGNIIGKFKNTSATGFGIRVLAGVDDTVHYALQISNAAETVSVLAFYGEGSITHNPSAGATVVWNETGVDADFRVEGDTDVNLFFVDASTDRVGVGLALPLYKLHVAGTFGVSAGFGSSFLGWMNVGTVTQAAAAGDLAAGLTGAASLFYDQSVPILYLYGSAGTIVNQISAVAGTATVFNELGSDQDFRIEGDTDANLVFVDASTDHVTFGTTGQVNGSKVQVFKIHTDLSGTLSTCRVTSRISQASASTATLQGLNVSCVTTGGNAQTMTGLTGIYAEAVHQGTNTLSTAFGFQFIGGSTGTGTITTARAATLLVQTTGGGTITTARGLFIGAPTVIGGGGITNWSAIEIVTPTAAGTNNAILTGGGHIIFNEDGGDYDVRIEGDTATNLLKIDAGLDAFQIGTTTAGALADFRSTDAVFNEPGADVNHRFEGDSLAFMLYLNGDATLENIALLTTAEPDWQTMDRGMFVGDVTTAPTGNPASGGFMYSAAGAGTWRGSGGTVTAFGPAGPHCGNCGYDFWDVASENESWGAYLRKCGWCGKVYKKGPASVIDRLTPEQKAELIYE